MQKRKKEKKGSKEKHKRSYVDYSRLLFDLIFMKSCFFLDEQVVLKKILVATSFEEWQLKDLQCFY